MTVEHITNGADLDAAVAKSGLVVVDFSATWCGPCRMIAPVYEKLSNEHTGVSFVHVDIDQLNTHALVKGISSVPTFHFYKNGSKVSEFAGASENQLKSTIEANK